VTREIGDILRAYDRRRSEPFALATLVRATGSSYRKPGARLLIADDGSTVGCVSGGCLEREIAECGRLVIRHGKPVLLRFDTRAQFGCDGRIEVLVERVRETFMAELEQAQSARRPCHAVTCERLGSYLLTPADQIPSGDFVQAINPPLLLLLIGRSPDTEPLLSLAGTMGWVCVRTESVNDPGIAPDEWSAAIIGSHNYGRDFAALRALLATKIRYIGLIGSQRRRQQLLADLLDTGIAPDERLFSPAGLDLGGEAPEAIALAIASEVQAVFAGGSRASMRQIPRSERRRLLRSEPAALAAERV
jgi:xanthine/CO dehydrogenase XdhC/CoxF family maturation factor